MNKYLEKAAELYNIEPHKADKTMHGVKSLSLNREEMMKLKETEDKNYHAGRSLASSAAGALVGSYAGGRLGIGARAAAGAHVLRKLGPEKFTEFAGKSRNWKRNGKVVGMAAGAMMAGNAYLKHVHQKSLNDAGFSSTHHNDKRRAAKFGKE